MRTTGKACLTVDADGNTATLGTLSAEKGLNVAGEIMFNDSIKLTDGKALMFRTASAPTSYLFAQPQNGKIVMNLANSIGTPQDFTLSGQLSAGGFKAPLATPSSGRAPCQSGEFANDQNYHYVCVAQNHWKRAPLSDF